MSVEDPKAQVRRLYRGVDGFGIAKKEERKVRAARSSATYGEIMPTATLRLLEALQLRRRDVFYDLGCGVGKVPMMAAIVTPARRCVGVELAADRLASARSVLAKAEEEGVVRRGRVELREADILRTDLSDATVLYTCSTAFPTPFMRRVMRTLAELGRPLTFATLQVLDDHPAFVRREVLDLDMSWKRRSRVYIYRVNDVVASREPSRRRARR